MSITFRAKNLSRIRWDRIVVMTVFISFGAFLLFVGTADWPPFERETVVQRLIIVLCSVISWPVFLVARIVPENTPDILALPVFILPGLFWASVVELILLWRHRHKA